MKKHIRIYMKAFDYGEQDFVPCEVCKGRAVDVHHIDIKGMGGAKNADVIENLMGLCRDCHNKAHRNELSKKYLTDIHLYKLEKICQQNS